MSQTLRFSLVIEHTEDPNHFGYYSPDLPGYAGDGVSVEDCISKAKGGVAEYLDFIRETGGEVPKDNPNAAITFIHPEEHAATKRG